MVWLIILNAWSVIKELRIPKLKIQLLINDGKNIKSLKKLKNIYYNVITNLVFVQIVINL